MAKKKLPDFSLRSGELQHYFSAENTQPIADKFGFPPDYPLADKLNHAASWLDPRGKGNLTRLPEGAEGKALFEEMAKLATDLAECFNKLGMGIFAFVAAAKSQGFDIDPNDFGWKLQGVANTARKAARDVPDKKPGPDPDIAFFGYIEHLRKIYCEGTGKKDRITYNTYDTDTDAEAYSGAFFDFVKDCLSIVGIAKKNGAVAKAIKQTLSFMDKNASPDASTSH